MAKTIKKRYFVLGLKASIFFDPFTRLKVVSKETPTVLEKPISARIKMAIERGHIKEVDENFKGSVSDSQESTETSKGSVELTEDVIKNSNADDLAKRVSHNEINDFYSENYQVSEEDQKAFDKLNKAEKIQFLQEDEE